MRDLAARLDGRVELITDTNAAYQAAVEEVFRWEVSVP